MVSRMCYLYHYTPQQALGMQAVQFFTLLREGEEMKHYEHVRHLKDLTAIQAISIGDHNYYKLVYDTFDERLGPAQLPPKPEPPTPVVKADSPDAAAEFRGIFGVLNGG